MSTTTAQPDLLKAIIGHLLVNTTLTNLTSTRISGEFHNDWLASGDKAPSKSLLIRHNSDVNNDPDTRISFTRMDVRCYGQTGFEAMKVWNVLKPTLCPGADARNSFSRGGCRVYQVGVESGPIRTLEPDTKWPVVFGSFIFMWSEVPATVNSE